MSEITWGTTIRITDDAPAEYQPGALGEVVGISDLSEGLRYTVEFADGSDVSLLAKYVEISD